MSLVEVMVALMVTTVAVYLLSATITATVRHTKAKRERAVAAQAAMNLLERMRAEPFSELFARHNDDPSDDPDGPGTAPGPHFDVRGLRPHAADPEGAVGEIVLPSSGRVLREDGVLPELGLPRDLDGDLRIDAEDHAADYVVLPVTVRLRWRGVAGEGRFQMSTTFANITRLR